MKVSDFFILIVFTFSIFACKSTKSFKHDENAVRFEKDTQPVSAKNNDTNDEETLLITYIEDAPLFEGKSPEIGFKEYVNNNVIYPQELIDSNIEGRVFVEFFIEVDGSLGDVKVIRGLHPLLDAEALRVISNSPKWTPAKQRGKALRLKYVYPVMFRVEK